jgi:hypothetical protein
VGEQVVEIFLEELEVVEVGQELQVLTLLLILEEQVEQELQIQFQEVPQLILEEVEDLVIHLEVQVEQVVVEQELQVQHQEQQVQLILEVGLEEVVAV